MANEVEWTYASQVTLEASGASGTSDAFIAADDADLTSANHSDYPLGDFCLVCDFAATPAGGKAVHLYRRDLNIDGSTGDAPIPDSAYKHHYVGTFPVDVSTSQAYFLADVPLTQDCEFYIENNTNQNISAGWDLYCTPKTYKPGS